MSTIPTSDTPRKVEISWDQVIDGDFPEPGADAPDLWQRAVRRAADALRTDSAIPTAGDRLASATDLVLSGGVTLHADGTATVKNGSRTHEITDACSCADAQHRSKWCKHVLVVVLWKRATVRIHLDAGRYTPIGLPNRSACKGTACRVPTRWPDVELRMTPAACLQCPRKQSILYLTRIIHERWSRDRQMGVRSDRTQQ